jgi:recombination protein RecT
MQDSGFSVEKVKQEISFALQLINKSQQLQKCSKQSLQVAVLNISNIGLSLNPAAKEAYLIPRYLNGQMEAVLEPGYVGLVKLLTDAGSVKSMVCQLVYEKDSFEIDLANNVQPVKHKPELSKSKRGNITGAYALATLIDGTRQVEYMSMEDIDEIKLRSETYKAYLNQKIKSCTWVSDYGEMARKTVIKRIYKYLPRTERMQKIDEAIKQDNLDFTATDAQVAYIETLLLNSTLDERQRGNIEMELTVMGVQRAGEVIEHLKENQQISDKEAFKKLAVK